MEPKVIMFLGLFVAWAALADNLSKIWLKATGVSLWMKALENRSHI
jgi:hypothetical protein